MNISTQQFPLEILGETRLMTACKLNLQSLVDEIEITEIIINRGNAQVGTMTPQLAPGFPQSKRFPATLKYGDMQSFASSTCGILEVTIKTDRGDFTFHNDSN
jgi:hypothetical protein